MPVSVPDSPAVLHNVSWPLVSRSVPRFEGERVRARGTTGQPGSSLRIQSFVEFLLHGPDLFLELQVVPHCLLDLFNNPADGLATCATEAVTWWMPSGIFNLNARDMAR
jgi:hypothetical protein